MKISKKSWHYRFQIWAREKLDLREYPPQSLCPYFWSTIGLGLLTAIAGVIVGVIWTAVTVAGALVWLWSVMTNRDERLAKKQAAKDALIMERARIQRAIYELEDLFYAKKISREEFERRYAELKAKLYGEKKVEKVKEPSLIMEFIRAKKAKVCPLIEFVDEE